MAVQETRVLPPQFIEDLATDYGTQLTALTSQAIDTSKFAPTVAQQDPLQAQAATLASSGIGSFQPFVTAAQTQAADASTQLGTAATGIAFGDANQYALSFQGMEPEPAEEISTSNGTLDVALSGITVG